MTDAQAALAQVREALADRPSAGPWVATLRDPGTFQVATVDNFGVYSRHPDHGGNAAGFPEHDATYIAKCNPENIAAILAHVEAQEAEIKRLREFAELWYFVMDEAPRDFERIVSEYQPKAWLQEAAKLRAARKEQR